MINFTEGDIFKSKDQAIVNTVNCVGVMGNGIALEFKKRYPDNYNFYKDYCKRKLLKPGALLTILGHNSLSRTTWVVNFATKDHWRNPSKLEWIIEGLKALNDWLIYHNIESISIPGLGTSNGGLEWSDVGPLYEKYLTADCYITVYYNKI